MTSLPHSFETNDGRLLTIDFGRLEELEEVYDFSVLYFVSEPPIRQLSQCDDDPKGYKPPDFLKDYVRKCLSEPRSLLARDSNGKLAAVMLNVVEERLDGGEGVHEFSEQNLTTAYLEELYRGVDLFEILDVDKIFHLAIVAVSSDYARQGLASKLFKMSLNVAAELGIGAAKTEAGSAYVAKVATKYGFVSYKNLDFASIEYNGDKPLADAKGMGEHATAHLMARHLP